MENEEKATKKICRHFFRAAFLPVCRGKNSTEPMMIGYQGKFNAAGWSGSGNDHSPCLQGEGYLTGLRLDW